MMRICVLLVSLWSGCVPATLLAQTGPSGYHLVHQYNLGGEGGWDYLTLDGAARRLFIARSTRVMVVDADSGKLLSEIPDTPGVHGVALVPALNRGFISNGREGTVSVFDLETLKVSRKIKVGENPDAILYDPSTKRVFVFNGRSHDASVIEAETEKVVGTIPLSGKPEFGVSDGQGRVYVNIEDKGELALLDPGGMKVKATWPLAPCEEPTGLALDRANHRLFSGCSNKLMAIVDGDSGKLLTTLPIGDGVDGVAFDPESSLAFSSNGEGTVTVVKEESPQKFSVLETVPTVAGARTITLDPKSHQVYTVTKSDSFELLVLEK
jgi:YVTN family beta-propeller protein